jgi:predicted RNA binding protein YcfA (HicA-like mRNA interferase family)
MKLPRDLHAHDVVKALARFGYIPTRQTGSHIRLTTQQNGQHHCTVPAHSPIKIGTLNAILSDIAAHHGIPKAKLMQELFGE